MKDTLGDRMKRYEDTWRISITPRMPAIIRLDGKAFHTLTRNYEKPFDKNLRRALVEATMALLNEVPGRMAYHQSDEVSVLLIDFNKFDSQQWFDGLIQKMVSVAASVMGVEFSMRWKASAYFDARVLTIPERDVENYFIWRQKDAHRNAISMAAQAVFSPKQLEGVGSMEKIAMLKDRGVVFDDYPDWFRLGSVVTRAEIMDAPLFTVNRDFLKGFLKIEEE